MLNEVFFAVVVFVVFQSKAGAVVISSEATKSTKTGVPPSELSQWVKITENNAYALDVAIK